MSKITIEEKEFIAASELAKASAMKKDAALAAYFWSVRKSLAEARTKSMENIARNKQKRKSNIQADVKKRKKTIGNHWP